MSKSSCLQEYDFSHFKMSWSSCLQKCILSHFKMSKSSCPQTCQGQWRDAVSETQSTSEAISDNFDLANCNQERSQRSNMVDISRVKNPQNKYLMEILWAIKERIVFSMDIWWQCRVTTARQIVLGGAEACIENLAQVPKCQNSDKEGCHAAEIISKN